MQVAAGWIRAPAIVGCVGVVVAVLLAACSGAASTGGLASTTPASPMLAAPTSVAAPSVPSAPSRVAPSEEPASLIQRLTAQGLYCLECQLFWDSVGMSVLPPASPDPTTAEAGRRAWLQMRLTTAHGGTITLADFAGRPVIVEMMATWCTACADQQDTIRAARSRLPADAVIISVSVDPRDDPAALARYAADRGYDWDFATAPVELLRSLGGELGDAALNPAVTPIVVIDRAGGVILAPAGHKDVAAIAALVGT